MIPKHRFAGRLLDRGPPSWSAVNRCCAMAAHFHARLPSGASTLGGALYMASTAMESISGEVHACSDLKRYVGVTKRLRNRSACAVCSQAKVKEVRGEKVSQRSRREGGWMKGSFISCAGQGLCLFHFLSHAPPDMPTPMYALSIALTYPSLSITTVLIFSNQ